MCCCVLAGCSAGDAPGVAAQSRVHDAALAAKIASQGGKPMQVRQTAIAPLPDQGRLLSYEPKGVVRKGTVTWRPVAMSEAHALNAIVGGEMVFNTPEGDAVRLRYDRHEEHADGNWTWKGRAGKGAQEAVITFGEKAVFGVIPYGNGKSMEITTVGGRTWVVDGTTSDPAKAAADAIIPQASLVADATNKGTMRLSAEGMAAESVDSMRERPESRPTASTSLAPSAIGPSAQTTIDLLVGYTTGFATRLGGNSQAVTRVQFMVDLANTAYSDSQVQGRLRLVGAQSVDYPDTTSNQSALFDLSSVQCVAAPGGQLPDRGVSCINVTPPAALQPLISARQTLGADVVSLVRKLETNGSCGYAWLLGNSQQPIETSAGSRFGFAVVQDTSGTQFPDNGATCRNDSLAHELGHLMGLQHDTATAMGADDTNGDGNNLDPEEYGRFADSFGYRTDATAGNFATTMAQRLSGQGSFRVFANPRLTTCGGFACGQVGVADQAATLARTMPTVEAFMPSRTLTANNWLQGDFDGDHRADVLWHNLATGTNVYWKGANAQTRKGLSSNGDIAWAIAGIGDFNGDNRSDILWRNRSTGSGIYWLSADSATRKGIGTLDLSWNVGGIGDFDGDGADDVLWRNAATGVNTIWKRANVNTRIDISSLEAPWFPGGVGDFDHDGKADILWRNPITGLNSIWKAGSSSNRIVNSVAVQWIPAAVGDLNGDGRSDIVWRNTTTGANLVWWSGDAATRKALTTMADTNWCIVGIGDYNNDGKADLLWRHSVTGANSVWWSGTTSQTLAASGLVWIAS
jgi:hypothetical protein